MNVDKMSSGFPKEVSIENLASLGEIFRVNWPKHIAILSSILTFVERLKVQPEDKKKLKIIALSESWKQDGSVLITFERTETKTVLFFDTIDDSISETLKNVLKLLDYTKIVFFCSVRNIFRPMILDIAKELDLRIYHDITTNCHFLPREDATKLKVVVPDNLQVKSLSESHVELINSLWAHRYKYSEKFVSYSIKYHANIGFFNKNNELVAWCLRYDNGSLGMLQVINGERKKGYGSLISKLMCKKVAEEFGSDVISEIVPGNFISENMFAKIGFKKTDLHAGFEMRKKS